MAADQHARALGRRIARARGRRTQQEIADMVGVGQTALSNWELGRAIPRRETLGRLERVLDIPKGTLWSIIATGGESPVGDQATHSDDDLKTTLQMIQTVQAEVDTAQSKLDRISDSLNRLEEHVRRRW